MTLERSAGWRLFFVCCIGRTVFLAAPISQTPDGAILGVTLGCPPGRTIKYDSSC